MTGEKCVVKPEIAVLSRRGVTQSDELGKERRYPLNTIVAHEFLSITIAHGHGFYVPHISARPLFSSIIVEK